MLRRLMPFALAGGYAAIPLFPSFIVLVSVAFPGVSLLSRPMSLATLAFGFVLAIYWAAMLLAYRKGGTQPMLLPMLGGYGAAMLSSIAGFDLANGLLFVTIYGLEIVWHCALMRFYADRGVARAIFWSYLLSGTIAATAAVVMIVMRAPATQYAMQHGRATGTFILPAELAAYLIVFLPIAYALARIAPDRALRGLAWLALAAGAVALQMTYSRAGWMGFAAAAAFLVGAQTRRLRHGATAALVVVGCGVAAVLLLFNAHHNPSEDYTRISIWQAAAQIIDRFPLTGVGPFDFSRLYAIVRVPDGEPSAFHAHSMYLTFLAELGIVGFSAVVWIGWSFAVELRRRLAHAKPEAGLLAIAATAGLVGVAVQGLIDTVSVVIFCLWLPTMALALSVARYGLEGRPE
jgi:O-antigen ligase